MDKTLDGMTKLELLDRRHQNEISFGNWIPSRGKIPRSMISEWRKDIQDIWMSTKTSKQKT